MTKVEVEEVRKRLERGDDIPIIDSRGQDAWNDCPRPSVGDYCGEHCRNAQLGGMDN